MPVRLALRDAHLTLQAAEAIAYLFIATPVRLVGADGIVAAVTFHHAADIEAVRNLPFVVNVRSLRSARSPICRISRRR
jgi:hypothetical protein